VGNVYDRYKMFKNIYIIVLILGLVACSTIGIKYNYRPETSTFSVPQLGIISTAGLGEPLLDKGNVTKRDVLFVEGRPRFSKYVIENGKFYKTGEDAEFEYFKQDKISIFIEAFIRTASIPGASVKLNKSNGELCVLAPGDPAFCGNTKTKRKKENVYSDDSFRKTLIYNGRVGNKLKVGYREYMNNMARTAFSNEVIYDLSESTIIGYAGARIEVIDASNTELKYKVIKNFK